MRAERCQGLVQTDKAQCKLCPPNQMLMAYQKLCPVQVDKTHRMLSHPSQMLMRYHRFCPVQTDKTPCVLSHPRQSGVDDLPEALPGLLRVLAAHGQGRDEAARKLDTRQYSMFISLNPSVQGVSEALPGQQHALTAHGQRRDAAAGKLDTRQYILFRNRWKAA